MSDLNKLDVLDAEKRLARLLKTAEGKQAFRNITGSQHLVFAGEAQEKSAELPIVALLMPSYRGAARQVGGALNLMIERSRSVCQVYAEPTVSTSVVHWSRNAALSQLLKSFRPFDYVLFMDDDIGVPPDALIRLLSHKADIVAGACTVRQDPPLPNFRTYDPTTYTYTTCFEWGQDRLIAAGAVGTGLMLISMEALKKIGEYYINCKYEEKFYGLTGDLLDKLQTRRQEEARMTADFWWFEFLKNPLGKGEYGEDVSFCFKARECGIPVYVDTSVKPLHWGEYGYSLDDYLEHANLSMMSDEVSLGQRTTDMVEAMMVSE